MSMIHYLCFFALASQGIEGFAGFGYKLQNWPNPARNVAHYPVYLKDSGDCTEMTNTLEEVYEFAAEVSEWTYEASANISSDVFAIFNCSGIVGTIPCVISSIGKTRDDLLLLRPDMIKFEQRFVDLYLKLKTEVSQCLLVNFMSFHSNLMKEISTLEARQVDARLQNLYYRMM